MLFLNISRTEFQPRIWDPPNGTHLYRMEEKKEGRAPKSLPVERSMLPLGKPIPFDRSPLVGWADGTKLMLSPNGRSCCRSLGNV